MQTEGAAAEWRRIVGRNRRDVWPEHPWRWRQIEKRAQFIIRTHSCKKLHEWARRKFTYCLST